MQVEAERPEASGSRSVSSGRTVAARRIADGRGGYYRQVLRIRVDPVVGKTTFGAVVNISMPNVPYNVAITSSSPTLVSMGMTMGAPLVSGTISISASGASGGGILRASTPSQMAFTASSSAGQFQCLMAGFTAGFSLIMEGMTLTIIQMDVHGAVAPGSYTGPVSQISSASKSGRGVAGAQSPGVSTGRSP